MADIYILAETLVSGIGLASSIFLVRWLFQRRVDVRRRTYELEFSSSMGHAQVLDFIRSLSSLPKPRFLEPVYAVSFERYANARGERWFLHIRGADRVMVDQLFLEHVDGTMKLLDPSEDPVYTTKWDRAIELGLSKGGLTKPLNIPSPMGTSLTFGARFKDMTDDEAVLHQIQVYPDKDRQVTPENKDKLSDKMFHATIRLAVAGGNERKMLKLLKSPFHSLTAFGVKFVVRSLFDVVGRVNRRASTWGFWVYLNALELSVMLWPLNGTGKHAAKRLPATMEHDQPGEETITLGTSNSPRTYDRPVAVPISALTLHSWIQGPTGSGKSTLFRNIGVGVMNADLGLFCIDPKGDLNDALRDAVPFSRRDEVIDFNPSRDTGQPIGLNILRGNNPSRITGHVLSMFKIYSGDAWGHQMARVLRLAIYTACIINAESVKNDDEILSLYDVKQLLVNKGWREELVRKINRNRHPDVIREWGWVGEKHDLVLDAPVTRLEAFLGDPVLCNIVGQRKGLNMDEITDRSGILFCTLNAPQLGDENANALGMLIWEMIWDAHQRRAVGEGKINVLMADEYQMYAGQSLSRSDPWALARSQNLGLVVANQSPAKLPRDVYQSVSTNAHNVMTFAAGSPDDAQKMRDFLSPLTADDLQFLPQHTVAARVMGSAGRAPTVTLKTLPPPRPTGTAAYIINRSRHLYGVPVEQVQADLLTRHKSPEPKRRPRIGEIAE